SVIITRQLMKLALYIRRHRSIQIGRSHAEALSSLVATSWADTPSQSSDTTTRDFGFSIPGALSGAKAELPTGNMPIGPRMSWTHGYCSSGFVLLRLLGRCRVLRPPERQVCSASEIPIAATLSAISSM